MQGTHVREKILNQRHSNLVVNQQPARTGVRVQIFRVIVCKASKRGRGPRSESPFISVHCRSIWCSFTKYFEPKGMIHEILEFWLNLVFEPSFVREMQ